MNGIAESEKIHEIKSSQNIAYVLEDNGMFVQTGYKVLKNQSKANFIECAKVKYNGKIKLLYFTTEYKSLSNIIHNIDSDSLVRIVVDLIHSILEIKNNGFLLCQNLDLSLDKIFVDKNTMSVKLIYLPVNIPNVDIGTFENELRTQLIKLISSEPRLRTEEISKLLSNLSNGTISLDDLYKNILNQNINRIDADVFGRNKDNRGEHSYEEQQPTLIFKSINSLEHIELKINKKEYVIGRNPLSTDGVITNNKAIGRTHCKILYKEEKYYLVDLNSANGTYLNEKRINPMQEYQVNNGDYIRLANSDFQIYI